MANETALGGAVGTFRFFGVPVRPHFTSLLLLIFLLFIGVGQQQSGLMTAVYRSEERRVGKECRL